jgi:hypothetical protein
LFAAGMVISAPKEAGRLQFELSAQGLFLSHNTMVSEAPSGPGWLNSLRLELVLPLFILVFIMIVALHHMGCVLEGGDRRPLGWF